ncbi:MAG: DUF3810 domain-containing protein [Lachnospiraceae bacterium]|nr:DUF3810 domain-containing protein [Lachnospiraceae bacterium]
MLAVTVAAQLLARNVRGFAPWYTTHVYPVLVGVFARVSGVFPFSVSEIALYVAVVWVVASVVRCVMAAIGTGSIRAKVIKATQANGATQGNGSSQGGGESVMCPLVAFATRCFLFIAVIAFLYTANCGVNYYAAPFSQLEGLVAEPASREALVELCEYLTKRVNEAAGEVYGEAGAAAGTGDAAVAAMVALGGRYPSLAGYYPRPKGVWVSRILSVQQLSGVYSPFAVEANYNREMTAYNIPHTMCHELSHLRGFMREDEANFIGFLACIGSEDAYFRYSGWVTGWVYAGNALARADREAYLRLYGRLDGRVVADLGENNAFWDRFEGKVAEVAEKVNDTYLKANSQSDGVQSYGRMVDLMLGYGFGERG